MASRTRSRRASAIHFHAAGNDDNATDAGTPRRTVVRYGLGFGRGAAACCASGADETPVRYNNSARSMTICDRGSLNMLPQTPLLQPLQAPAAAPRQRLSRAIGGQRCPEQARRASTEVGHDSAVKWPAFLMSSRSSRRLRGVPGRSFQWLPGKSSAQQDGVPQGLSWLAACPAPPSNICPARRWMREDTQRQHTVPTSLWVQWEQHFGGVELQIIVGGATVPTAHAGLAMVSIKHRCTQNRHAIDVTSRTVHGSQIKAKL
jgi:hypothetical protein